MSLVKTHIRLLLHLLSCSYGHSAQQKEGKWPPPGQVSQRAEHQPSIHVKKKRRMELLETPVGEGDSHPVTGVIWKFRVYLALGSRVLQKNC